MFLQLANTAEQVFASDPNTTLIKLRQLGKALAQDLASRADIEFDSNTTQSDLIYKLSREIQFDKNIRNMFHSLRVAGKKATHEFRTQHREAGKLPTERTSYEEDSRCTYRFRKSDTTW